MNIEELHDELVETVASLMSSGFDKVDAETIEKLHKYAAAAEELDLKEGKKLINNLSDTIKAIHEGRSHADSGNLRLTALDFYLKKYPADGTVEDL